MTISIVQRYSTDHISKIPIVAYTRLCNCVFCWEYFKTHTCSGCGKLFCPDHKENHYCFREDLVTINPISVRIEKRVEE